jgi:tRNA-2-methylthio-N6-dimethylallyladenosine synthase
MNVADSELMFGVLKDAGYEEASRIDEADVVLINTCAVRESAEERIYGRASQLLRFKYENPDLVLGITGCMAEHLRDKIVERAPYVDLLVGPDAYRRLPGLIEDAGNDDPVIDVRLDKRETYEGLPASRRDGVSGWVTIQRGCDKFCTFCIVPFVRGRERGTPPREVLRQVRDLATMGYKEVTLLGQTVNSYQYEDADFADLLRAVHQVDGIERIRYTSPYPVDFTPKLVETLAELPKVCNFLHLPLQSGSNTVLEDMRRGYTVEDFMDIVTRIRSAIPDIGLSTDVIVGFPTEEDDDFRKTLDIMREVEFDSAFMFAYSEREGTYASKKIDDKLPESLKKERLQELIKMQNGISEKKYAARIGKTEKVMLAGPAKRGPENWIGRTEHFKNTIVPASDWMTEGDIIDVTIDRATSHTLYAEEPAKQV